MSVMTETSDDRTPPPTVWGTFQARDAHAMIDFLVKLGFEAKAVHDRAVAAGAEITRELQSPPYGGLEFGLKDPEGNGWFFGSYRGAPRTSS
jgi:uncharacterized glyoxalase superfamily protein PhnB